MLNMLGKGIRDKSERDRVEQITLSYPRVDFIIYYNPYSLHCFSDGEVQTYTKNLISTVKQEITPLCIEIGQEILLTAIRAEIIEQGYPFDKVLIITKEDIITIQEDGQLSKYAIDAGEAKHLCKIVEYTSDYNQKKKKEEIKNGN